MRVATNQDHDHIQKVYFSAFPEGEREVVAKLAIDLLFEKAMRRILSLVAEADGAIIGHIAFSPVEIDQNKGVQGYILAPLGVKTGFQKRGFGSKLVEHGIRQLSAMGVNVLFVYGDPKYYGRFGFSADAAHSYIPSYKLQYPFAWQAIVLNACDMEKTPVAITCVQALCKPELW